MRRLATPAMLLVAVLGSACADGGGASYEVLDEGRLTAAAAPDGDVALEVHADDAYGFSLDDLVAARTVKLELHEPFLNENVTFTGVPLADVVAATNASDDAITMHMVALNDYAVDVPLEVLDHPDVLVATHADGEPISLEAGGPIRIVFGDDHPATGDEALWIWSLATIEYR